jgi:arylsulfatase A-like enzyme
MAGGSQAQAAPSANQSPGKPNIVLIIADDLGYADLGCQGAKDLRTPHLDSLAASGARFTNWYAGAPVCAPSRGSLMTGRYPQRNGVANNGLALRPSEHTIASLLKSQGYATGIFGKWHLGSTPETVPNAHGFDQFFGFHSGCIDYFSHRYYWGEPRLVNYHDLWRNRTEVFEDGQYMTELITREAKQFLAARRSEPFFLYVPYNGVHYPMHAPRKYVDRFPAAIDPERRMYAALLAAVDDSVGEIMAAVKKMGALDNTLVFYQADNGATREPRAGLNQQPAKAGNNGILRGSKFSLFDGGMHVPSIVSWPGKIPAGQVIPEIGIAMDVLPTMCKAAGVALPSDRTYDGVDLMPRVTQKAPSPHQSIFWKSGGQLAVRRGPWKLVQNGRDDAKGKLTGDDALFLSNLRKDPGETTNLRHSEPALADELLTLAKKWQAEVEK